MDARLEELNTLLEDTFSSILRVEEKNLRSAGEGNLSISEFHTLQSVGDGEEGRSVGEIAEDLGVTVPTVTVSVNRLVKKGYVVKSKSSQDARITLIRLTDEGRRMNRLHRFFHEQMVFAIRNELADDELDCLLRCVRRLNVFFDERA
jgi:DNA-binding MarR family transcriptional regulator